jgi:hypothetical protein
VVIYPWGGTPVYYSIVLAFGFISLVTDYDVCIVRTMVLVFVLVQLSVLVICVRIPGLHLRYCGTSLPAFPQPGPKLQH